MLFKNGFFDLKTHSATPFKIVEARAKALLSRDHDCQVSKPTFPSYT